MLYNKIPKIVQAGIDFLSAEEIKDDSAVEKLQFLIKKGLSNSDILHVLEVYNLRQKNLSDVISGVDEHYLDILRDATKANNNFEPMYHPLPNIPPPLPEKDWKDVFVMTAATTGVAYAMFNLMNEFIIPKIMPKSQNELDKDKAELQSNLDEINNKLKEIDDKYNEDRVKENLRVKQLDDIVKKLNSKIDDLETEKLRIRQDFSKFKKDIANVSVKFDEFIQKYESQNTSESLNNNEKNPPISQHSFGVSSFHHTPIFENQLSIQNIPNTADILSKMNLKPTNMDFETSSMKKLNTDEIRDQIENITLDS
ncbi:uncharacterized protein HGUI_00590 [Hanseniaspora guilliermondii]|uniref:Peroxisomal membrane protein PEX14 n=1 Tax=Hanseniaspora guilliermondii TaxID=56406 RepID=A0A1L0FFP3_9ASCO|nr:uncharacterized protein HGUI_00590 [Hanseniaspora guilliermondii]